MLDVVSPAPTVRNKGLGMHAHITDKLSTLPAAPLAPVVRSRTLTGCSSCLDFVVVLQAGCLYLKFVGAGYCSSPTKLLFAGRGWKMSPCECTD